MIFYIFYAVTCCGRTFEYGVLKVSELDTAYKIEKHDEEERFVRDSQYDDLKGDDATQMQRMAQSMAFG